MDSGTLAQAALVFLAFIVVDFTFAKYTVACAEKRVPAAMLWSALIPLFSGFVAIQYVSNPWMLVPTAAGAAVGTYLGMVGWAGAFTSLFSHVKLLIRRLMPWDR